MYIIYNNNVYIIYIHLVKTTINELILKILFNILILLTMLYNTRCYYVIIIVI